MREKSCVGALFMPQRFRMRQDLRFCGPLSSACAVYVWSRAMGPKVGGRPSMRHAVQAVPRCAKPRVWYSGTQSRAAQDARCPGVQSRSARMVLRYAKPHRVYDTQVRKAAPRVWCPGMQSRTALVAWCPGAQSCSACMMPRHTKPHCVGCLVPRCAKPRRVYGAQAHKAAPHQMPGDQVSQAALRRSPGTQESKAVPRRLPGAQESKAAPCVQSPVPRYPKRTARTVPVLTSPARDGRFYYNSGTAGYI